VCARGSQACGLLLWIGCCSRRFKASDPLAASPLSTLLHTISDRYPFPTCTTRWFIDLQTALAIDILLHIPLRIENLAELKFDEHLHWPQGKGKPALMVIREDETKNEEPLEFELPSVLSDRLCAFRNEIAAALIGRRPEFLFVSKNGKRRSLATLRVAIQRTGVRSR
jgi:hypothetical protein